MFKRIMVPIETKSKSEKAIQIAYELAQMHQSEIILFNVIRTKALDAIEDISTDIEHATNVEHATDIEHANNIEHATNVEKAKLEREEKRKQLEEDSYKMLIYIKKSAPDTRMKVFIDIVEGEPASKITEMAKKNKVDLIIMPKTGKIGPRRVLFGDISIKVVESTDIPVMLVA